MKKIKLINIEKVVFIRFAVKKTERLSTPSDGI
jgi:hypothetical protein